MFSCRTGFSPNTTVTGKIETTTTTTNQKDSGEYF